MPGQMDAAAVRVLFSPPAKPATGLVSCVGGAAAAALELIFPSHCAACQEPLERHGNRYLCLPCARKIRWIGTDRCRRCGDAVGIGSGVVENCPGCRTHPPAFIKASCAVAKYGDGPLRDLVLGLKFGARLHLTQFFAQMLAERIKVTELSSAKTLLVPVPVTRKTFFSRHFNQAEEIALCVGRRLNVKVETRLLQKVRGTPPQAMLNVGQRRLNLNGAFACNPRVALKYSGCTILLLDDVMTTGSTISECARTLNAAGFTHINAAAVARA